MKEFILGALFGIALFVFALALFIQYLAYSLSKEVSNSRRKF